MRPIRWRRPYYRLLDIVIPVWLWIIRPAWQRTVSSRWVRWPVTVLSVLVVILVQIGKWLLIATMIVGTIVTFTVLSFVSGKNSLLNMKPKSGKAR
jgi:hypothetical protein